MRKRLLLGAGAIAAIVGFLLFRPDTIFTNVRANESLADAFTTSTAAATTQPEDEVADATTSLASPATTSASPATTSASPATTSASPDIESVATGAFFGIDHRAAGTATIYQSGDQYVLRFEDDTDIQNGPDLYVWLLASDSYESGTPSDYIDLGTLKGNIGGQNYDLPAGFDPALHRTVLIWCLRFAVPFAAAPLS